MTNKNFEEQSASSIFHITSRCINKAWFDLPLAEVWQITTMNLKYFSFVYNLQIHAYVLMNNHFHLLVTVPDENLSSAMQGFISTTSQQINERTGRINQVFARRFKRCRLKDHFHYMNTYKYIYQNPVRAGVCQRVEDYSYSSLRGLIGLAPWEVLVSDELLLNNLEKTLEWLNLRPAKDGEDAVRKALKHAEFTLPAQRTSRNKHELGANLL